MRVPAWLPLHRFRPVWEPDAQEDIPRYPPFSRGLPAASVERVLATQRELVEQIQDALGCTDPFFRASVLPVLRRYAALVHLLPASEAHHHRGAGGLLRHGLEVAFWAARATQGRVFAMDRTPTERRQLEPRWRLAACLAGLCHDIGKPVSDLSVVDRHGRLPWRPLQEGLVDWARAHEIDRYFLRWRDARHRRHEGFSVLVMDRVLTPEITTWLVDPEPEIMQALLAAVAGVDDGSALTLLVAEADRASVERDLRENRLDPDSTALGVPVERYLLDAMRRLVRGGRWGVNVPGARVWVLVEGTFVVWRAAAAEEITALLAADRVPGVPRDPDTLADILIERGHAVARRTETGDRRYWRVAPAVLGSAAGPVVLHAIRLAAPGLLFPGEPPAAVPGQVVQEPGDPADLTPAPAPAPAPGEPASPADPPPSEVLPPSTAPSASSPTAVPPPTPAPALGAGTAAGSAPARVSPPPDPEAEAARAWLVDREGAGRLLLTLAADLRNGARVWGRDGVRWAETVLIPYPEGLAGLGRSPAEVLATLAAAGCLAPDPRAPLRAVRELQGRRGVVLERETALRFLVLTGAGPAAAGAGAEAPPAAPPVAPGQIEGVPPSDRPAGRAPRTPAPGGAASRRGPPSAVALARAEAEALVGLLRAGEPGLPGGVERSEGWCCAGPAVLPWFQARPGAPAGVSSQALVKTLARRADCRLEPDGRICVKA